MTFVSPTQSFAQDMLDNSIVYPNPTPDKKIVVEYQLPTTAKNNTIHIRMVDIQGKTRHTSTHSIGKAGLRTSLPLDLSHCDLPAGAYILQVQSDIYIWTKKIIIN